MSARIWHRAWPGVALLGIYGLILLLLPPRYEVPQNDDWACFLTIEHWFETGRLEFLGWNDPTLLLQLWWGGLFARLFGLSFTSLRLSTLALSWLGALALFGLLRRAGASRGAALLGAGMLVFHPLYLLLSYSYNADVPYLALALVASWACLRALERRTLSALLGAGLLLAFAYLVRQQALALAAVAAGAWGLSSRPRDRRTPGRFAGIALLTLPGLAAAVVHLAWVRQSSVVAWGGQLNNPPIFLSPTAWPGLPGAVAGVARAGAGLVLDASPLLLPAALLAGAGWWREWKPLRWIVPLAVAAGVACTLWWMQGQSRPTGGWPYVGNYLDRRGPLALAGIPLLPRKLWLLPTWLAPLLAGWLCGAAIAVSRAARRDAADRAALLLLVFSLAQWLPSLALASVYDRFLMPLVPAAIVIAARRARQSRGAWIAAAASLLLLAAGSVEWTRVAIDRSRARWEVGQALVARGARPGDVRLGYEWDGLHLYREALRLPGVHPPFELSAPPWQPLTGSVHRIQEYAEPRGDGTPERSYRRFLRSSRSYVGVAAPGSRGPAQASSAASS